MTARTLAAPAAGLAALALAVAFPLTAAAHTPQVSHDCTGLHLSARAYGVQGGTVSVTVDGRTFDTVRFGDSYKADIAWDETSHTYRVVFVALDGNPGGTRPFTGTQQACPTEESPSPSPSTPPSSPPATPSPSDLPTPTPPTASETPGTPSTSTPTPSETATPSPTPTSPTSSTPTPTPSESTPTTPTTSPSSPPSSTPTSPTGTTATPSVPPTTPTASPPTSAPTTPTETASGSTTPSAPPSTVSAPPTTGQPRLAETGASTAIGAASIVGLVLMLLGGLVYGRRNKGGGHR